jgi:UDP-N-acetylmuramoylalanine--D-glutamate ligase
MQMIENMRPGSTLVHDSSYTGFGILRELSFGPGGDVYYDSKDMICSPLISGETINPCRSRAVDLTAYRQPVLCAATAALALGVSPEDIEGGLKRFDGVPGRMRFETLEGRTLLDNSSSGLSIAGVAHALSMNRGKGRRVLVMGEEKYNVCEGLEPGKVLEIAGSAKAESIVLVGDRLRDAARATGRAWAPDLKQGIAAALAMTTPGDTIISCVKTWR